MIEPRELHANGHVYKVDFVSTNAQCRIEEATGLTYAQAIALAAQSGKVTITRQVFQAALVDPANATPEQVGDIIDEIGLRVIVEGLRAVFIGARTSGAAKPARKQARG